MTDQGQSRPASSRLQSTNVTPRRSATSVGSNGRSSNSSLTEPLESERQEQVDRGAMRSPAKFASIFRVNPNTTVRSLGSAALLLQLSIPESSLMRSPAQ